MEMLLAAIHNGADAVYMGMPKFNARGRTQDFSLEELKEMIELSHLYGVKVHLAFNILIFEEELKTAIDLLHEVLPLGVDALIVQDLGLAKLIRKMAPDQVIHGSTQMTVTNHEAMNLIEDLKIDRFVLGREVSIDEMKIIREKTDKELEVFVHGALCVSYSGQCLTSESLGGRSANRGQCAQSCRLDYQMYVDGRPTSVIDEKYFVSPKDLCGIDEVSKLSEMGIDSFKIEGRLKSKEYVASTASNYKKAILGDKANNAKEEMAITYSRGFFSGWLNGVNHQELVDGTYSAHQGLGLGKIASINHKNKTIKLNSSYPLKLGDGLLFTDGSNEIGLKIYEIKNDELAFSRDANLNDLNLKMEVFLNSSPSLDKALNLPVLDKTMQKKILVTAKVTGRLNAPLIVKFSDGVNSVTANSTSVLSEAKNQGLTENFIKDELASLGGTCFKLDKTTFDLDPNLYLNHKEIKELRRNLVQELTAKRITPKPIAFNHFTLPQINKTTQESNKSLNVLVRTLAQAEALKGLELDTVYLDFEYGKDYRAGVELIKSFGYKAGIATTRILKPTEYKNLNIILKANPDVILVRNLGALKYFNDLQVTQELIGDYSLNVTNSITANYLTDKKLKRFTPSYDLNQWQVFDLLNSTNAANAEITIHQYIPEFHMEHCVFAAFLSDGKTFRDCGMPCEKHTVELKDPYGNMHQLSADQECRNTMYRGTPQSAGKLVPELLNLGVGSFRLEALAETPHELIIKIQNYSNLINNKINAETLFDNIQVTEKYGLMEGQLSKNKTYQDRKKVK